MKRAAVIILLLLTQVLAGANDYRGLDSLLTQFYDTLLPEPVEAKTAEFDRLISSCRDSLTRQHVALAVFDHYRESKLMGEEEVAVHIFDRWFADGTIKMTGDMEKFDAQMFADFNRSTLIGMEAPVLTMKDNRNRDVTFPEQGRSAILFFFDTACSKCQLEAKVLPEILGKIDFPVNFYSIYCGQDKKAWCRFRSHFKVKNSNVTVHHLWDPEYDTEYLRLYGVISTPRMYMTEPQGSIIGRRLEPESLMEIIPVAGAIQAVYDKHIKNTESLF